MPGAKSEGLDLDILNSAKDNENASFTVKSLGGGGD